MKDFKLLALSFCFIFSVFCAYAILRPVRDALGIHGDTSELKWLFLGTFVLTLLGSFVAVWVSGRCSKRRYFDIVFGFFALNLLGFYALMKSLSQSDEGFIWLCRSFYMWASVFNLFIISLAWSLLNDVYSKENSKKFFGIITAGASLGSIAGASFVSFFKGVSIELFFAISLGFLIFALLLKRLIISYSSDCGFESALKATNPFAGAKLVFTSKYLLGIAGFILLLTAISTFLYMEQARIVKLAFASKEERSAAFAMIDLVVQSSSFFIQLFLTGLIARKLGLEYLLGSLGLVLVFGFILLIFAHPAFMAIAVVMSVRRIGEYALIKPGREMLFTKLNSEEKYKAKLFLDAVVYRAGDSVAASVESLLASISLAFVLGVGAVISAFWSFLGYRLGRAEKS